MYHLLRLWVFVFCGYLLILMSGISHVEKTEVYHWLIYTLLAIGLYSSTYQIDQEKARSQFGLIIKVVTVGVLLKVILIGGILFAFFQQPVFLLLGVVVAQIDPISVAAVLRRSRISTRARAILAAWSSFDDPVTVLLALFIGGLVSQLSGVTATSHVFLIAQHLGLLALNFLFAALLYGLCKRWNWSNRTLILFLCGSLLIAIYLQWMLAIALIGLFLRPPLSKWLTILSDGALWVASFLLGMLLIRGIDWGAGLAVAVVAFGAQILVGWLLTGNLSKGERLYLAFSQQNGVTAIVLALMFAPHFPQIVSMIAPAILFINGLHLISHSFIEKRKIT